MARTMTKENKSTADGKTLRLFLRPGTSPDVVVFIRTLQPGRFIFNRIKK